MRSPLKAYDKGQISATDFKYWVSLVLDEFLVEWISPGDRPELSEWVRAELMPRDSGKKYSRLGLGGRAFLCLSVISTHWSWFCSMGQQSMFALQTSVLPPSLPPSHPPTLPAFLPPSFPPPLLPSFLFWLNIPYSFGHVTMSFVDPSSFWWPLKTCCC